MKDYCEYRVKGAKNKPKESTVVNVPAKTEEKPVVNEVKTEPLPNVYGVWNERVAPDSKSIMIDAYEMTKWLKALQKMQEEDKKLFLDAKHILKEIVDYIDRNRLKQ